MLSDVLLHLKRNAGVTRTRTVIPWFRFFAVLVVIAPLVISTAAGAADMTYTGDGIDLQTAPTWFNSYSLYPSLFPGTASAPLSADNNVTVNYDSTVSGMTNPNFVVGGLSEFDDATNNEVKIIDGYINIGVVGGASRYSNAEYNNVTISGGYVAGGVVGGMSHYGNAEYNIVTVNGGGVGGDVYGGYSGQGAVYNKVIIISGDIAGAVIGGYGEGSDDVTNNSVTISGGNVAGGVAGGYSGYGNAQYNSVTISGGAVATLVAGGFCITNNAQYNTVTIMGNPTLINSYIYGGFTGSGTADAFTGNTLNFKSSNISAVGVSNFQYYNFYLPENTVANETMLSVTHAVDLSGTTVEIFLQGSSSSLQAGDKVALINSAGGVSVSPNNTSSTASLGAFMTYDFSIYSDANNLWAQLAAINNLLPSNVILTDSRLAPLAFLSQGADLVASLEYLEVSGDKRFNTFAIVGGGSSTYDIGAGAEVDVDGFSMLAGVMWNAPVNKNSLIVSAFFEAGWGSYDTYRDFGADGVVRGSGDSDYYGGGLHMRYKWDSGRPGGLYAEGSLRFGRNKSDFHTNDLSTVSDFSYDSSSNYFGAHVGLGYVWQLSGKTRLEAMSKYLWTRLGSDEVTASSGDRISFDSLNSSRWRTGFRMYHDYGNANAVTLYYGAMYEYEFGGDAEGRLGGLGLDGISPSGGSGIGELGVIFRPSKDNDRLTMQLGVQGYVGAREGVSGTLKLQYAF